MPAPNLMIKLCVEGWRKINHSYAIVNQKQLIEFSKYPIYLRHKDIDFIGKDWNELENFNGFSKEENNILDDIKKPLNNELFDITLRISFPYNFDECNSEKLFVFGTSEYQNINGHHKYQNLKEKILSKPLNILTPSNWSKEGFIKSGFDPDKVSVIPHGVDIKNFYPIEDKVKNKIKRKLGIKEDDFVILNIGSMTENKGIDYLLVAFFILKQKYNNLKLILKDQSNLFKIYASQYLKKMKESKYSNLMNDRNLKDVITISNNLNILDLNNLYNIADCYVSPYRAEGFNLTPLEAASSGTPIIVTKGGSTDDYFDTFLGLQIESKLINDNNKTMLEPNLDSLINNILKIKMNKSKFDKKKTQEYLLKNYSWKKVTGQILDLISK